MLTNIIHEDIVEKAGPPIQPLLVPKMPPVDYAPTGGIDLKHQKKGDVMTNEEVTEGLTNAMRLLNQTLSTAQSFYDSIDPDDCPICTYSKKITELDIETIESARKKLTLISQSQERDDRIVATSSAIVTAMAIIDKITLLCEMTKIAHENFEAIANANVEEILKEHLKERLEKAIKSSGIVKTYDPKKVN